jgi:integrase
VVKFVADVIQGVTRCDEKVGFRARAIVRGGRGVAARALAVLSAVYSHGIRRGLVDANPTKNIKPPKGKSPGKFLTKDEWSRLGEAMRAFRGDVGANAFVDAINLIALSGCRRCEVTRLRWTEVDLEGGLLRLEHSKTGPGPCPWEIKQYVLSPSSSGARRAIGFFLRPAELVPSSASRRSGATSALGLISRASVFTTFDTALRHKRSTAAHRCT